jgi:hypothetical protein
LISHDILRDNYTILVRRDGCHFCQLGSSSVERHATIGCKIELCPRSGRSYLVDPQSQGPTISAPARIAARKRE